MGQNPQLKSSNGIARPSFPHSLASNLKTPSFALLTTI